VIEPNRRRITGSISYKPLISDISVLRVCNKTGGTIKGDKKKEKKKEIRTSVINSRCYDYTENKQVPTFSYVVFLRWLNVNFSIRHPHNQQAAWKGIAKSADTLKGSSNWVYPFNA
jgi:hypothetical protein